MIGLRGEHPKAGGVHCSKSSAAGLLVQTMPSQPAFAAPHTPRKWMLSNSCVQSGSPGHRVYRRRTCAVSTSRSIAAWQIPASPAGGVKAIPQPPHEALVHQARRLHSVRPRPARNGDMHAHLHDSIQLQRRGLEEIGQNPEDLSVPVKALMDKLGGKLLSMYYMAGGCRLHYLRSSRCQSGRSCDHCCRAGRPHPIARDFSAPHRCRRHRNDGQGGQLCLSRAQGLRGLVLTGRRATALLKERGR
jgi:hypothetical protein